MTSFYSRIYWRIGFVSRLYDWLTPEAYRDSMRRSVECVLEGNPERTWLDAGCGSGLAMDFLKDKLKAGDRYVGTDRLFPALDRSRARARALGLSGQTTFFNCDLTAALPLPTESVDIVLAHFSIYTIGDSAKRQQALAHLRRVLKRDGVLVLVSPSPDYDAKKILRASVESLKTRYGKLTVWFRKWMVYPWSLYFGLNFIQRQLECGIWHASTLDQLCEEIRSVGFEIRSTESAYAESAHLIKAVPVFGIR